MQVRPTYNRPTLQNLVLSKLIPSNVGNFIYLSNLGNAPHLPKPAQKATMVDSIKNHQGQKEQSKRCTRWDRF